MDKSLEDKLNRLRGHLDQANKLFGEIVEELGAIKKAPTPSKKQQEINKYRKLK